MAVALSSVTVLKEEKYRDNGSSYEIRRVRAKVTFDSSYADHGEALDLSSYMDEVSYVMPLGLAMPGTPYDGAQIVSWDPALGLMVHLAAEGTPNVLNEAASGANLSTLSVWIVAVGYKKLS